MRGNRMNAAGKERPHVPHPGTFLSCRQFGTVLCGQMIRYVRFLLGITWCAILRTCVRRIA